MYSESNAQSSQFTVVRQGLSDEHLISHPSLGTDGFNIWWKKTTAQNMKMVKEATHLMHAHRLIHSTCLLRALQVQRAIKGHHV